MCYMHETDGGSMDESVFERAQDFIKEVFSNDFSGHDVYHTIRVHNMACTLCSEEGGDRNVIRLAALLHDVDDRKLFGDNGYANARRFMDSEGIGDDMQERICGIISQISFKGKDSVVPDSLEGRIVQDADRLDAIGAIGIGRAFAYGGSRGRAMHIPGESYCEDMGEQQYFANEGTTINHFYEKLLLLKDMMNTDTARAIAEMRHEYMLSFLNEFLEEWDGDC